MEKTVSHCYDDEILGARKYQTTARGLISTGPGGSMLRSKITKLVTGNSLALAAVGWVVVASLVSTPAMAAPSRGPQLPVSQQQTEATTSSSIMTFQTWKNLRLEEARLVLERLSYENQSDRTASIDRSPGEKQAVIKTALDVSPRMAGNKTAKSAARPDARIEQAQMNLEIAQDLTVNDYIQIYLSRFKSREAMLDVARRMAPEDVADLLISYQKLSSGSQVAEHSSPGTPRLLPRSL
jgi:hypothetical protein